jgi:hypothetical protein
VPRASRSGSGVTGSAYAIVATPQPIEQPIPAEWRAPLARFLHELGAPDVESILDSTKGGPIGGFFPKRAGALRRSGPLLARFILDRDRHHQERRFHRARDVHAGKWFTRGDVMGQLLGRLIPAPVFAVQQRPRSF